VSTSDKKIKMTAKIQYGCQFPAFYRITPHNFCTIKHKSDFGLYTHVCMYELNINKINMIGAYLLV